MTTSAAFWKLVSLVALVGYIWTVRSVSAVCDFSFVDRNKLYNYSLASPIRNFPHGILSEDGYYKVEANGTTLWFQLCDGMIFNHQPPVCVECTDCGGPSRCGMGCSALVAERIEGYPVCITIGRISHLKIDVIDKKNPHNGVLVQMWHSGNGNKCSLSVSVLCNANEVQGPHSLQKQGECDYTTVLKHPSGCANVIYVHGSGLGWFGTVMILCLCLFGAYLLAGAAYRYYSQGIRGIDVIPNLELWASIPQRIKSFFGTLMRKYRGHSEGHRASYSAVNF
uniref:Autophagy-related protein 27 n=3 Tax=Kalanchoe fedtschenkoi TaxID=63787 RepID=A0A7N0UFD0_KALFE